ncbi:MAG: PepSY-associated TM helix domain-containing protein [Acidobacteriota bacterium]|nr:PepSY-associated TM helix domain-containing protein [Acidobacteriota bacterium]
MKTFRSAIFWMHLIVGVAAGVVVLIMSITGVALTYEKQMLEWADRRAWTASSSLDAHHLPPETLLAKVAEARPGVAPTGVTLRANPAAPATVTLEGNASLLVDPYTGVIIGAPPSGLRNFFRTMTVWHRYLALQDASRATGKAVTGAANLAFLFIVLSGMYLWLPRVWTWLQFKAVLWFRGGLPAKARDFNWHNVIGIWSAVPLAVVVAGAVPISYPWASNLVYRLAGDRPPAAATPAASPGAPEPVSANGLNAAWSRAQAQVPAWRTMTVRLSTDRRPLTLTVDQGYGGQPQQRATLTIDRVTGDITKAETFADLSAGRRARSWLRFAHTGEFYGLAGQTIAGIVSAGSVVLVYTGLALACRRFRSWIRRRGQQATVEQVRAA